MNTVVTADTLQYVENTFTLGEGHRGGGQDRAVSGNDALLGRVLLYILLFRAVFFGIFRFGCVLLGGIVLCRIGLFRICLCRVGFFLFLCLLHSGVAGFIISSGGAAAASCQRQQRQRR